MNHQRRPQSAQRSPAPVRAQRGFAAVYAAISLIAMLTALGLAIDVGNLYYAQRNLQRLASLAAIDGARVLSGCNGSDTVPSAADVQDAVTAALGNNGANAQTLYDRGSNVRVGHPVHDSSDAPWRFEPLPAGDPNLSAVQVNLKAPPPTRYIQMPGATQAGTLQASAAAMQYPVGSFQIGATLLNINSAQSALLNPLLGGLLGTTLTLPAVSYQGLAGAQVSIGAIATAVGLDVNSNLQDLLDTSVTLPGALNVIAKAVDLTAGGVSTTAGQLINQLAVLADPSRSTTWGSILGVEPVVEGVVTNLPVVDALSLILALGESASQGSSLALPINASIPGLLSLNTFLSIPEGIEPSSGVGRAGYADPGTDAQPYTAAYQVNIALGTRMLLDLSALGTGVKANLGLDVAVAPGSAALATIQCPVPSRPTPIATIDAKVAGGRVTIGTYSGSGGSYPPITGGKLATLTVLGLGLVEIDIKPPAGIARDVLGVGAESASFDHFSLDTTQTRPPPVYKAALDADNPVSFGSNQLLTTTTALVADLLNCSNIAVKLGPVDVCTVPLVSPVLALLGTIVSGVVGPLVDTILSPLLSLLGIQVGVLTVQMNDVGVGNPAVFSRAVP